MRSRRPRWDIAQTNQANLEHRTASAAQTKVYRQSPPPPFITVRKEMGGGLLKGQKKVSDGKIHSQQESAELLPVVPRPPPYLNGNQAVILDELACIILAITALIWKHVLSAVVAVALFFPFFFVHFFSLSQSGDLGALWEPRHCLSTHG